MIRPARSDRASGNGSYWPAGFSTDGLVVALSTPGLFAMFSPRGANGMISSTPPPPPAPAWLNVKLMPGSDGPLCTGDGSDDDCGALPLDVGRSA
jgi:hypothetical protein